MKQAAITEEHYRLAKYIVTYRRSKGIKFTIPSLVESLILAYAKQIVTGILDHTVRANMMTLITHAEEADQIKLDRQIRKQEVLKARAKNAGFDID